MNKSSAPAAKERVSSIELLRIIAMYMIVIYHYVLYSGFDLEEAGFGIQKFTYQILHTGGIGVATFIMISGFFGYKSKSKPKKMIDLLLQVQFYSILAGAFALLAGNAELSVSFLLRTFLPTTFKQYWFFTAYIVLMLISPYINIFINAVSRENHLKLIGIIVIMWSVIPFITDKDFYLNEVLTFFSVYIIGAYLGKYPDNFWAKKRNSEILLAVCVSLLLMLTLIFGLLGRHISAFSNLSPHLFTRMSPLSIGLAVGLIMTFSKMKIKSSFINKVSSCVFAVYLLHENPYTYPVLWKKYLKAAYYVGTKYWFVHMIICTVAVFTACIVIEMIRKKAIEKPVSKLIDKTYDGVAAFINNRIKPKIKNI